jgi:hypothetical protein
MFPRLTSLVTGLFVSGLVLLVPACGGGGIGPDTREPYRAVMVLGNGNGVRTSTWTLPGVDRPESAALPAYNGVPESTLCDDPADTTNGRDIDGRCYATLTGNIPACSVFTGFSRYDTRLGTFSVRFVNNQGVSETLILEGFGFNLRVHDANGVEVWNMLNDHDDLRDAIAEIGYLQLATDTCANGITVFSGDAFSSYSPATSYGVGTNAQFPLAAGGIFQVDISWDGRDSNGALVPSGTYTVYTDVTVRDPDTGLSWENPEPATITIAPAPSN